MALLICQVELDGQRSCFAFLRSALVISLWIIRRSHRAFISACRAARRASQRSKNRGDHPRRTRPVITPKAYKAAALPQLMGSGLTLPGGIYRARLT